MMNLFDPAANKKAKEEKAKKKKALADLYEWSMNLVPENLRQGLILDINEVVCGDPSCAPVDTVFTFVWNEEGGRGRFTLPYDANELNEEELSDMFPNEETLIKWKEGKKAPWPPRGSHLFEPALRFAVGDRVECRVGPHPVKGWAAGRIIKLHYSESTWPPNVEAPYQIKLNDGRLIFAPQDTDAVIRLRPPREATDPPSPDFSLPDEYDGEREIVDLEDDDEEMRDVSDQPEL